MDSGNMYTEYKDEKNQIPWFRMIIIALIIACIIFILLILIRGCTKTTLVEDLQNVAKSYYEKYPTRLPSEVSECKVVSLSTLESDGLVKNDKFSTCDKENTYVTVCYLENQEYNYSATLSCGNEISYGEWKDGSVSDLGKNSDVRFLYTGEQYKLAPNTNDVIKYYFPNNVTDANLANTYYSESPSLDYTLQEGQASGYKWYTEKEVKTYWNNGGYSATAPSGYVNKDSQTQVTKYSETKPSVASYRTISEATIYSYKVIAVPVKYICVIPGTSAEKDGFIVSPTHCALNTSKYTQISKVYYSCDGGKTTTTTFGTVCQDYTDWSEEKCVTNNSKGIQCKSVNGYKYVDTVYKWYTNTRVRSYYPSGSATADLENAYYVSSPLEGAIRDDSTGAQVYKFYKADIPMVEQWVDITGGFVTLEQLINTFNNLGYNVKSLSDINTIEDIRYQFKMQYRDVEE